MSKNRNLKYQFMNCIQKNFRESVDKHAYSAQTAR